MKAKAVTHIIKYKLELDHDELQILVSLLGATGGSGKNYDMYCMLSDLPGIDDDIDYEVISSSTNRVVETLNLRRK